MIKAIVFDMDDTLYPEWKYVFSGFQAVNDYLEKKSVFGFYETAIQLFERGKRGKIFNDTLDILKVTYRKEDIQQLIEIYRNHNPAIQLFTDAQEVLEQLHKKIPLGLISDGYLDAQRNKVKALKINQFFKKIILTDELGRDKWKPSPESYQLMRQYFNVQHKELVYVGDNTSKDFVTANKLGWTTIQIIRDSGEYKNGDISPEFEAQLKINSLIEIIDIINIKI
ncbi:HAD family hydrolase [Lysinibacillus fusiformis]|nr:HAD family hydrolase [Lysinibacillus fusiformis]